MPKGGRKVHLYGESTLARLTSGHVLKLVTAALRTHISSSKLFIPMHERQLCAIVCISIDRCAVLHSISIENDLMRP